MVTHQFPSDAVGGTFVRRYKRFFVDVTLDDGQQMTAHTSNTGAMRGLLDEGNRVLLTKATTPGRKLPFTLEAIHVDTSWVGVNTILPNALLDRAIRENEIAEFAPNPVVKREVPYLDEGRADFLVDDGDGPTWYVEAKSVTMRDGDCAVFPDAKSERGTRHLRSLIHAVKHGHRAMLIFLVQRTDCVAVAPARSIDPAYADALIDAYESGVAVVGLMAGVSRDGVAVLGRLPVMFDAQRRAPIARA